MLLFKRFLKKWFRCDILLKLIFIEFFIQDSQKSGEGSQDMFESQESAQLAPVNDGSGCTAPCRGCAENTKLLHTICEYRCIAHQLYTCTIQDLKLIYVHGWCTRMCTFLIMIMHFICIHLIFWIIFFSNKRIVFS